MDIIMPNNKQNNNEVLEQLKEDLMRVAKEIPHSEVELFLDFMKNIWGKLFISKNNDKPLDFHYVINYIESRMRNTKNRQHQAFWAKIYKMLEESKEKLIKIL